MRYLWGLRRFQSTRPSRASTPQKHRSAPIICYFNPQGPRGPRLSSISLILIWWISIHKALAGLDFYGGYDNLAVSISIHKALAGLDHTFLFSAFIGFKFQSTRPSRASTLPLRLYEIFFRISIHKALAGLDISDGGGCRYQPISIHKALAGLDTGVAITFLLSISISIHKALAGLDM